MERWHKAVDKYYEPPMGGILGVLGIKGYRPRGRNESKLHHFLSGAEGNNKEKAKQKSRYDKKPGLNGK